MSSDVGGEGVRSWRYR